MNKNWLNFSYRLIVLYGFYVTVQGVEFPLEIDKLIIESEDETVISYDKSGTVHTSIIITRNESDDNWFDVWTSSGPDLSLSLQLEPKIPHGFQFFFRIKDLYSFVMNTFAGQCYSSLDASNTKFVRIIINSRENARSFRFDEIYSRMERPNRDNLRSYSFTSTGLYVGIPFHYELSNVLIYSDGKVKRLRRNSILDSNLIEDSEKLISRQFLIHPPNDEDYRFSDILFTAQFVNTAPMSTEVEDRVVLGIWITNKIVVNICLIFASDAGEAYEFHGKISPFINSELVIDNNEASSLINADLQTIEEYVPS